MQRCGFGQLMEFRRTGFEADAFFRDRQLEVLLHFVIADDLAHSQSDHIFTLQRLACSLSGGDDLIEIFFRRLEQFFTLASAFVGQQRIATHDQSFTGKMFFVGDLRQILFVEQRPVDPS